MKELQMPASYGRIPEAEQFQIVGGGELADAWNDFTDRLRLDDLFFSGGVLSLSFSFVPMLLFTAVKNVVLFGYRVYNKLLASSIFRLGTSTSETVQHLAAQQETNSFPLR